MRKRACKDLHAYDATRESMLAVVQAFHRAYPNAELTDSAIAKHYPRFSAELKPKGPPPCPECEIGGGPHLEECSLADADRDDTEDRSA